MQRVGEVGIRHAIRVFWVCRRTGQELPRGYLEPDAVATPPREFEVPEKHFDFDTPPREVERPKPLAVPVNGQQPLT